MNVFLSASVPLPTRDLLFFNTADVVAIRDAVKALALEVTRNGTITFGGHPAITPLLALILEQSSPAFAKRFILYQSAYFFRFFPQENNAFIDVRVTAAVGENRSESLRVMRQAMLSHTKFEAGFFIGGMEGVIEEFDMFRELQPHAHVYPIASTGGAALELYRGGEWVDSLLTELTYPTLFRRLLRGSGSST
jgi:SLOG cluster3 family